jgi:Flp pilus assembly protein TadG
MWSRRSASRDRSRRGQALVEFALVLPVLLVLLLLAVDFGRLFTTYVSVNNAAREGAFYAAEHAKDTPFDQTTFDNLARAAALREVNVQGQGGEGTLSFSGPTCHVAGAPASILTCDAAATSSSAVGNQVSFEVTRPFSLLTPFVGELFGGSLDLEATATAPVLSPASVTILAPGATPTPTPTPTPDPAATPTPTPDPAATPTPTPAPTPPPTCEVPDVTGQFYNADPGALDAWEGEGFTGSLVNQSENKEIKSQSRFPGTFVDCTSSMTVSNGNNLAHKG